jgi:hypothetical protein
MAEMEAPVRELPSAPLFLGIAIGLPDGENPSTVNRDLLA